MNSLAKTDPKKRQNGHFLTVKHVKNLTPNMLRVTLNCPSLTDMDASRQGAHCKLLLPQPEMSQEVFRQIISVRPSELSTSKGRSDGHIRSEIFAKKPWKWTSTL